MKASSEVCNTYKRRVGRERETQPGELFQNRLRARKKGHLRPGGFSSARVACETYQTVAVASARGSAPPAVWFLGEESRRRPEEVGVFVVAGPVGGAGGVDRDTSPGLRCQARRQ
jgi:hypothetical protein